MSFKTSNQPDIKDALISNLTTIATAGKVVYYSCPKSADELITILKYAKNEGVKYYIIGKGSNLLIKENNKDIFISTSGIKNFTITDTSATAACGTSLTHLINKTIDRGLAGIETLWGIPATIGGAVYMNAGGRYGEIFDSINRVTTLTGNLNRITRKRNEFKYGYRNGGIPANEIILEAEFTLTYENKNIITERFMEIRRYKSNTQPLNMKSSGCIFKNPNGISAAELIDQSGLKQHRIGGAEISGKHSNFIINKGNATADDVLRLIEYIKNRVYKNFKVELKEEVEVIG